MGESIVFLQVDGFKARCIGDALSQSLDPRAGRNDRALVKKWRNRTLDHGNRLDLAVERLLLG